MIEGLLWCPSSTAPRDSSQASNASLLPASAVHGLVTLLIRACAIACFPLTAAWRRRGRGVVHRASSSSSLMGR